MIRFILFTSLLFSVLCVQAQQTLTPEQAKSIKEELKNYMANPAAYKAKQDEAKKTLEEKEAALNSAVQESRANTKEVNDLREQVQKLNSDVYTLQSKLDEANGKPKENASSAEDCAKVPTEGTFYKVQLGNYGKFSPSGFEGAKVLVMEPRENGTKRYLVSYFKSIEEAKLFLSDVRKLGIKDAFISAYTNGKRDESFDATK